MKKALVLYGSSRSGGNTEYLTDYVLEHTEELEVTKVYLRDCCIKTLVDERHTGGEFPLLQDDYKGILEKMLAADVVIFSTPVYWYNMSTRTKLFVDRWTESLRDPSIDLKAEMKGKEMYVICTGANPDEDVVQPMIGVFRLMAKYFGMSFQGYLWANADRPGDVTKDGEVLEKARSFLHS